MMKNEMTMERQDNEGISIIKRILSATWNSFAWGFISALFIGCLAAGIWTIIPTALLPWGSSELNLIGYVSHCSYAPVSTSILLGASLIGAILIAKKGGRKPVGYTVFGITGTATLAGSIGGLDVSTFIAMGSAVGVAIVLGIFIGILYRRGAD